MKKTVKKTKKIVTKANSSSESNPTLSYAFTFTEPQILKTTFWRGTELSVVKWANDFCSDRGTSIKSVNIACDGKAYTAFISYWSDK